MASPLNPTHGKLTELTAQYEELNRQLVDPSRQTKDQLQRIAKEFTKIREECGLQKQALAQTEPLRHSFEQLQNSADKKVIALFHRFFPPSRRVATDRLPPIHDLLDNISQFMESNPQAAWTLFEFLPQDVKNDIYGITWRLCGCPTKDSPSDHLRSIAHDNFGYVAFHDTEGRSTTPRQKMAALRAFIVPLALRDMQNLFNERNDSAAFEVFEKLPVKMQGRIAGKLWEIKGSLMGIDPDYGRAALYGQRGISSTREEKIEAINRVSHELRDIQVELDKLLQEWSNINTSKDLSGGGKQEAKKAIIHSFAERLVNSLTDYRYEKLDPSVVDPSSGRRSNTSEKALLAAYMERYPIVASLYLLSLDPTVITGGGFSVPATGPASAGASYRPAVATSTRIVNLAPTIEFSQVMDVISRFKRKWEDLDAAPRTTTPGAEKTRIKKEDLPRFVDALARIYNTPIRHDLVRALKDSHYSLMTAYSLKYPFLTPYFVSLDPAFQAPVSSIGDEKRLRVDVWQDTATHIRAGGYRTPSGKMVRFDTLSAAGKATPYNDAGPVRQRSRVTAATHYSAVENDCLFVAENFVKAGYSTLVIDMASNDHFGGSYKEGARAQEEEVCRRSDLVGGADTDFGMQKTNFYPLATSTAVGRGLYVPDITIFKTDRDRGYEPMEEPFKVAVGIIAATWNPALVPGDRTRLVPEEARQTKEKIRTLLHMAHENGHRALVLSALGAGAFLNPPGHIAELFAEVITEEFNGCFEHVCFAIIDDHNAHRDHNPHGNFQPFAEMVRGRFGGEVISKK